MYSKKGSAEMETAHLTRNADGNTGTGCAPDGCTARKPINFDIPVGYILRTEKRNYC